MDASLSILVATDLSDASMITVDAALGLARSLGATLRLVHVTDLTGEALTTGDADPALTPYLERLRTRLLEQSAEKQQALEVERERCAAAGVTCVTTLRDGRIWEAVLDAADEFASDLLVVGPHGRRRDDGALDALGDALLGSTADRVIRHARCPVWVVPDARDARAPSPLQAPLVALDFTPASEHALALAATLVERAGAALHLAHVLSPRVLDLDAYADDDQVLRASLERSARAQLERLAARFPKIECHLHVMHGGAPVHQQLADLMREVDASSLVVGVRRRSALGHLVLGSTAERCLRRLPRPVLVVPAPAN